METAPNKLLQGCRVLVVEDEAIIAFDIMRALRSSDAEVLGPARSLARALQLANVEYLDCGVLDVMLGGNLVFPVASILKQRVTGIVFYTGYYDLKGRKPDWPAAQILLKPTPPHLLVQSVRAACTC
jgi:DNA-binding response OmpR family regulator